MLNSKTEALVYEEVKMGLWNNIGSAISKGFKAGKKFVSDNAGTIANIGLTAVNPVAGGVMALARSGLGKKAWQLAKDYAPKAWEATKKLANEHAETIGNVASKVVGAGAAALDSYTGVPIGSALAHGAKKLAKHYAKNDTGWGKFAKGFSAKSANSNLNSQLNSQSNASNESNGHVAAGYSLSARGNYNGKNRKKSWFQG